MNHSRRRWGAELFIPEEIIEEILARLPVKSLLRFRCVSKSWRSLIRSEKFIKTHHQNSIQNPSFPHQRVVLHNIGRMPMQFSLQSLLCEEGEPIDTSPLDVTTDTSMVPSQVLGCYNGLLVCVYSGKFYLWNPSTKISKKLPAITYCKSYIKNCGFGWDESSGEYKVFALLSEWDIPADCWGNVYSSKTKSWKTIEHSSLLELCWKMVGVFVGGKLYWKISKDYNAIIFLDLKSEVFGKIELPFLERRMFVDECLGEIGGCLCVLYHRLGRKVRVWVMKESWERLVDLSLDHELLQRPFCAPFVPGSKGEIFVFRGSTFLFYNPRRNVLRLPKGCCRYDAQHAYVESLVSPEDV